MMMMMMDGGALMMLDGARLGVVATTLRANARNRGWICVCVCIYVCVCVCALADCFCFHFGGASHASEKVSRYGFSATISQWVCTAAMTSLEWIGMMLEFSDWLLCGKATQKYCIRFPSGNTKLCSRSLFLMCSYYDNSRNILENYNNCSGAI